ncbi:hypothetical protein [Streptomyces sp. NPDC059909]|uniref:hypothetical protein n=1 Tax=Streptomyces sp. NPDC059909 TaxID=3346998 RepID=UPI003664D98E
MPTTRTTEEKSAVPAAQTAAVLYVCAERSPTAPGLAAERAEREGRAFARAHDLALVETVTDPYGEPDPMQREGWRRVRELAAASEIGMVIIRWPATLAPEANHELRYREVNALAEHGVTVRYSWAPLASDSGGLR